VRGGRPFCWGVIFKILIVFGGSFSDIKGVLLGGHLTVMKVVFKQHLFVKESDVGIQCIDFPES